jgi:hypothetical protein
VTDLNPGLTHAAVVPPGEQPAALPDHVFDVDGDVAVPTEIARGPWSPDAMHGSPPAALLARCLERHDLGTARFPVRFTVELMRPVPLRPLRVACATVRDGRKLQLLQGSLFDGDVEVCRAMLLRFREAPVEEAPHAGVHRLPPLVRPDESYVAGLRPGWAVGIGFWNAMELSRTDPRGEHPGPSGMWMRLLMPIVAGEAPTPFQRVAAAADFGNAIAASFGQGRYACINADLTITLHRLPEGEWVGLEPSIFPEPNGIGVSESILYDDSGRIGLGVQNVLIDEVAP